MSSIVFMYGVVTKKIGDLEIDAFLRVRHSMPNEVTSIPIEDGAEYSDHIVTKAREISIEGFFGPTETRDYTAEEGDGLSSYLRSRMLDKFAELERLRDARELVTVVTGLRVYYNMAILGIDIDRDVSVGHALPFSIQLRELEIVKSQTATIASSQLAQGNTATLQANSTAGAGKLNATKIDPTGRFQEGVDFFGTLAKVK